MPSAGGAEISMYSLLRCLAERGHRISVFTSTLVPKIAAYGVDMGFDVHYVETGELRRALCEFCTGTSVDLIATQNVWADLAILFAREAHIPSIYFARSADGRLDISKGGTYESSYVIANSQHVAEFVEKAWGREAPVVRSIVRTEDYRATEGSRSYITIVNPIKALKGGEMFRLIAETMPDREFLAIEGWGHLRRGDSWNMPLLQSLATGLGYSEVWLPEDVDLADLKNVNCCKSTEDMRQVYAETRLLLLPSNTKEAIPRVAVEAMSNGIPVIGSDVGGLSEVLSSTGVLVQNYQNVRAWVNAIVSLDNPSRYSEVSVASKRYVESLDYFSEVSKCIALFEQVIHSVNS